MPQSLQKQLVKAGNGKDKPKKGDEVTTGYTGRLYDANETADHFDTSQNRGDFKTVIGIGMVIKGWDEGVMDMTLGEKSMLTIPGDLAYGDRFSQYLIDHGHQVWALSHGGGDRPGRPSWTIDLETLNARYSADPMLACLPPSGQSASYSAGGSIEPQIRTGDGSIGLGIQGVVIDQIFSRTGACPMPWEQMLGVVERSSSAFDPAWFFRLITWLGSVVQWARRSTEADDEALWRTLVADSNIHPNYPERKANGRASSGFGSSFDSLLEWIERIKEAQLIVDPRNSHNQEWEDPRPRPPPEGVQYFDSLLSAMAHRCVARTEAGTLALVPETCHPGDEIVIFQGFPLPFVLRKDGINGEYLVVGICYVHGAMDGEMLQKGLEMQEILLR